MKLQTVNVIEIKNDDFQSIVSFSDDEEGNRQAEEQMFKIAKENGYTGTANNADEFMDDEGDYWENESGYKVLITHS